MKAWFITNAVIGAMVVGWFAWHVIESRRRLRELKEKESRRLDAKGDRDEN